ncbi:restriction endonuclease subunit S [Clostridium perfringens]|uniref:restriction endonuclease subunit S n=1 Tax=Clostridium perfringens TaxID=1502 RepID=UPI0024BC149F|nr:restriction endonuclease subunit S [Clostridium perfringens]MDK0896767.1 restriction endonuclease subunit S [Clostridium perfringens]
MNHYTVPSEININEIKNKDFSFSPAMYKKVIFKTKNIIKIKDVLNSVEPFDKGKEPGRFWYMKKSPYYMIRTKSLQDFSCLLYPKGDSVIPINQKVFKSALLKTGDILLSKDSNIGEVCIIENNNYTNYMFSSGIVKLNIDETKINRYYLFSFLKHSILKLQLYALSPKGATITHAGTKWMDCYIPLPVGETSKLVEKYVVALTKAIVNKEQKIREKSEKINSIIDIQLLNNQKSNQFVYREPNIKEFKNIKRMDSAIYGKEYKSRIFKIENYSFGFNTPTELGFTVIPGPSLEIKLLKTRLDSDVYKKGFYSLILPTNISEYGTMNKISYLGTARKLPLLKQGDIIFGEAGFQKGRSIVLLEGIDNCTTNAHGLYARRDDRDIKKSIFFRCIFNWYRKESLIDLMAVGGSGGHFSPEYFDNIKIPKFPDDIVNEICDLYHSNKEKDTTTLTLDNFVKWHDEWNESLGIWELDREMKKLQAKLTDIQDKIIKGEDISKESIIIN